MAAPSWAGGTASLTWSPATVGGNNYGKLEAGHTKSETFKLTNSGGQASAVLTITLSGSAAFSITSNGCLGRSLGPGKSCNVTVEYAEQESGKSDEATLAATVSKAKASIKLEGKTEGTPQLAWSATTSNYGTVPAGNRVGERFTLTNSGTGRSESLKTSVTNTSGTAFRITSDGCTGKS